MPAYRGAAARLIVADTVRILSAGAPKAGVSACVEAFASKTGQTAEITFATAPVLRQRVEAGEADAEIVVAPVAAMEAFERDGRLAAGPRVTLGSVKAGVAVRDGSPIPDISSVDSLKRTLLAADAVIYNEASSGQYIAEMIDRLGLGGELAARTVRLPNGAAVMARLAGDGGRAIGFGQIPEIRRFEADGVRLVGPLPDAVGKTTTYAAGLLAGADGPERARALLEFMASDAARRLYAEAGLE